MRISATTPLAVEPVVAWQFFSDPTKRVLWQRTLRDVTVLDPGPPHVGQRWIDHTSIGVRPQLRTTELIAPAVGRPGVWAEYGEWRGITVSLRLTFAATPRPGETLITAEGSMIGKGLMAPIAWAVAALANKEMAADIARAENAIVAG